MSLVPPLTAHPYQLTGTNTNYQLIAANSGNALKHMFLGCASAATTIVEVILGTTYSATSKLMSKRFIAKGDGQMFSFPSGSGQGDDCGVNIQSGLLVRVVSGIGEFCAYTRPVGG